MAIVDHGARTIFAAGRGKECGPKDFGCIAWRKCHCGAATSALSAILVSFWLLTIRVSDRDGIQGTASCALRTCSWAEAFVN